MAKPIKKTPVLEGEFAEEFIVSMEKDLPDKDKLGYISECKKTYRALTLL